MLTPLHRRIVKRAVKLIEAGWTRGAMARDKNGYSTYVLSPKAARFCMLGALRRATYELTSPHQNSDVPRSIRISLGGSITNFNDYHARSKKQVIERLEELL